MIAALLLAAAATVSPCAKVKRTALCLELFDIYGRDQDVRRKWITDPHNPKFVAEMQKVDASNAARLTVILNGSRWPGKSLVGERGSVAAWTIMQHADLARQRLFLNMMQKAADGGELQRSLLAATLDRI